MMTRAKKFCIGIDLGTTNCAMAFKPLGGTEDGTQVFAIPQWEKPGTMSEHATLPSFLYLPVAHEASALGGEAWVPGRFARRQTAEFPGRVVHSAKSWLCHHSVDRSAKFLPWRSDALEPAQCISPVQASAILLQYLRAVWDGKFADRGAEFRFDAQDITITVPASFDTVGQRLTLDAARQAGYPESVRLIEEPQAAFYRWLEKHDGPEDLWKALDADGEDPRHVVVVDIGGGTSDFSLFRIARQPGTAIPHIESVAVGDHLLLGGDNIDLALAHRLQADLPGGADLSPTQWNFLVAQCRELKERCLSSTGAETEMHSVSIPGRGSGLLGGTLTGRIARSDIHALLMEGFFPECAADAEPVREQGALREWALPYATDSAITRYLAEFLRGRPPVDAVLFNGGSLRPEMLRLGLQQQIAEWQAGRAPVILENDEPDLAVARGAARFGSILLGGTSRIEAGAARSVYLEVQALRAGEGGDAERRLICILPHGARAGEEFSVSLPGLELWLGRPVQFQPFYSTRHERHQAGNLVAWNAREFHALPPLQTVAEVSGLDLKGSVERLPVRLSAMMNERGLLQVLCVSADPDVEQSWPLEFNLSSQEVEPVAEAGTTAASSTRSAPSSTPPLDPGVDAATMEAARERIDSYFRKGPPRGEKLNAAGLFKHLEKILGLPKSQWNVSLIRALWTTLLGCSDRRTASADHDEAWLTLAGFLLRPGFGFAGDTARMAELWKIITASQATAGKRIKLPLYITLRRVAGGLGREQQQAFLAPELPSIRDQKSPAELIRLVGAFERLEVGLKTELASSFIATAAKLGTVRQPCAPYLVALGLLLNRAPLYAGPAAVLPPALVQDAYEAMKKLDWTAPELLEIQPLFLRAARVVNDPARDVPKGVREKIASQLKEAGVTPAKVEKVRTFMATESSDQGGLFGEALPPGLVLEVG